jgi:hypothetical protein
MALVTERLVLGLAAATQLISTLDWDVIAIHSHRIPFHRLVIHTFDNVSAH